jgi:hypothetical protein
MEDGVVFRCCHYSTNTIYRFCRYKSRCVCTKFLKSASSHVLENHCLTYFECFERRMEFSSQHHHHHHHHSQQRQRQKPHQQQSNALFPVVEQEEPYYQDFLEGRHDNNDSSMHRSYDYEHEQQDDDGADDDDKGNPTPTTAFIPAQVAAAAAMAIVDDQDYSPSTVMHRIQQLAFALVDALDEERIPGVTSLDATSNSSAAAASAVVVVVKTQFSLHQARNMTSLFLVLSYCFGLLQEGKTTTLREVVRATI